MNKLVIVILIIIATNNLYPQNYFIENRGQWQPPVRFVGQSAGYNVIVTDQDILIDVPNYFTGIKDSIQNRFKHSGCVYSLQILKDGTENRMHTNTSEIRGVNKQTTYFNYFTGNDSTKWFTRVPSFRILEFKDSGRDASFSLEMSGKKLLLFCTNESTHITDIRLVSENKIPVSFNHSITKTNKITYTLDISDFVNFTNRNKKEYNDKIQWDEHDDRNLVFSSYLGGPNMEAPGQMYVDKEGFCYLTGYAERDFPTTQGSYKEIDNIGISSGYISKISPDGKTLLYSTYLSGQDASTLLSIKCDKNKNIYVSGDANSQKDYPMTNNALQQQGNRNLDYIISKLDPTGTKLLYSTFLGGTNTEDGEVNFIEVDDEENVYFVGRSRSKDYPVSDNCLKNTMSGEKDIVITKINTITGNLVYSTFFGCNSGWEIIFDVELGTDNCLYLCGDGVNDDFPVTKGTFSDTIAKDKYSSFISKLGKNGDSLVFSSFFSGTSTFTDRIYSLDVAENGNIFIVGHTSSYDFPVTSEDIGIRPIKNTSLIGSVFITELDPKCTNILHSTCINNKNTNVRSGYSARKISFDGICVWISGISAFTDFDATEGAFQKEGSSFFMKVSSDFRRILYLSYIEHNHIEDQDWIDKIEDMAIIDGSQLYISGNTYNHNFPVSVDSFQPWFGGFIDAYIMKFDMTTVGVGEEQQITNNELINIYPNPAGEYIEINLDRWSPSQRWTPSEIRIYNSLGECVLTPLAFGEGPGVRLDISNFPIGLYFIRFGNYSQKFIILR